MIKKLLLTAVTVPQPLKKIKIYTIYKKQPL